MKIKNLPGQSNKNPQGQKWRKLDNTGKLFPLVSSESLSNVFRIAVTLKEEINREILQQALEDILPQFESFRVRLRRGLFWYYFETNHRKILVEKEDAYPCQYISHKVSPYYLLRVSYYSTRINVEIYHALSDGLGAVNFAKFIFMLSYLLNDFHRLHGKNLNLRRSIFDNLHGCSCGIFVSENFIQSVCVCAFKSS